MLSLRGEAVEPESHRPASSQVFAGDSGGGLKQPRPF
jgi:hypothetical protein